MRIVHNSRGSCRSARRRLAAVLGAMLGAISSGCVVGPDFKAPATPTPSRYVSPNEGSARDDSGAPSAPTQTLALGERVEGQWWALFESSDVNLLVSQAISGSPTLESATAKLAQAREAVVRASGALYPQVDFNAGVARERVSASEFGLNANAFPLPPNFNLFQVGAGAGYSLDVFGGTRRRIEQQAALADVQRNELVAAYLSVTGNTVLQAIQLATARAQLGALADTLDLDRQNLDLVRKERRAGTVPDSDVIVAESQLAQDETLRPALEQQLSVARHTLAVLVGRAPGDWAPPDLELAALTLPHELPVSLPSQLVHQRPDIQAAEAQLHAASAQIGIATAQLYPSINLSADAATTALEGGQLFNSAGLIWSLAAGLTEPVFDGGMRRAERRAALAGFKASAADYKQTVVLAFSQVADILQALNYDARLVDTQQHALDLATSSVHLQQISYSRGGTGLINLIDAQRQYQQALSGRIRAQSLQLQDTVQLLVATGAGWWNGEPADTAHPARRP
jgi:NodT family efflux transporter outer membrane factor (OMF) lipoprotein